MSTAFVYQIVIDDLSGNPVELFQPAADLTVAGSRRAVALFRG